MLKDLFTKLTQSKEERYLAELNKTAAELLSTGSPTLGNLLLRFSKLKEDLDRKTEAKDSSLLKIDALANHAEAICDAAAKEIKKLAKLQRTLPDIVVSRNNDRLTSFVGQFHATNQSLMRGYSILHRAAYGSGPAGFEDANVVGEKSSIDRAADSLLVEVRTAERILNELGR